MYLQKIDEFERKGYSRITEKIKPKARAEENILNIMKSLCRKIKEGDGEDMDKPFARKKRIQLTKMLSTAQKTPESSEEYASLKNWFLEEEQLLERSYMAQIDGKQYQEAGETYGKIMEVFDCSETLSFDPLPEPEWAKYLLTHL